MGINYALLPNREWNKKQKHKKQPWSNVECFAFGGATVRFASVETSFHAANHTIPPPPRKDLRKQIHKHEQPPAIYTENQQVAVFQQSSQHCGPQPCELNKHRIIKYLQRKKKA